MSSTESSGAPAEAAQTPPPAPAAEFPTFGSTRGSGLARGKRPSTGPAASSNAAPASDYKPTAIEVVNAPREYTNPFAPATPEPAERNDAPAAASPEAAAPAPVIPPPAPLYTRTEPVDSAPAPEAPAEAETPAQLNILPPAQQKTTPAQTWESDGFSPEREPRAEYRAEPRSERPRRDEAADEPVDIASIPAKFLYVRPGVTFVPTPRNWGGAPRERHRDADSGAPRSDDTPRSSAPAASPAAPAKSGGFLGWLKSLFGGAAPAPEAVPAANAGPSGEYRRDGGGQRRHRGGRGRGPGGGEGGGRGRSRGGRGRSRGGDYGGGGGSPTT